jgi:hypothetical protein
VLSVVSGSRVGSLYFNGGALVHATYGNLVGERAFQRIFAEPSGQFEFTPGECPLADEAWTIEESTTGLLMEAARVLDTERAPHHGGSTESHRPPSGETLRVPEFRLPATRSLRPPLARAPEGDVAVASQVVRGLEDAFALAELRAWSGSELARATREGRGRQHFVVVVLADLAEGVSAMLPLGGAPTERWVIDCLSGDNGFLGLTFSFRHERVVDVVLGDIGSPNAIASALGCSPTMVVVAPPDGDWHALGVAERVALEDLFTTLSPRAVVGVGNRALGTNLSSMSFFQEWAECAIRCVRGTLGDGQGDLRQLLVEGFRVWASTGARTTIRPPLSVGVEGC